MAPVSLMQSAASEDEAFVNEIMKLIGSPEETNKAKDLFQNQDMAKLLEAYMEEDIPEEIRRDPLMGQFWAVLGRTIKLTFLTKEDVLDYEMLFEMAKIDFIMSIPPYKFTFRHQQMLEQLRVYFVSALRRSVGTNTHVFNERIILGGQINQVIRSNTESFRSSPSGGGVIAKLRSYF